MLITELNKYNQLDDSRSTLNLLYPTIKHRNRLVAIPLLSISSSSWTPTSLSHSWTITHPHLSSVQSHLLQHTKNLLEHHCTHCESGRMSYQNNWKGSIHDQSLFLKLIIKLVPQFSSWYELASITFLIPKPTATNYVTKILPHELIKFWTWLSCPFWK